MPPVTPLNTNASRVDSDRNAGFDPSIRIATETPPLDITPSNTNAADDLRLMMHASAGYQRFQVESLFAQNNPAASRATVLPTNANTDLPRVELEARAQRLFERFSDDGTLGTSPTTDYREIANELNGLSANDARLLLDIYRQSFSAQRNGRSLLEDIALEVPALQDRVSAFQALAPERVINQLETMPASSNRAGISTEPQLAEIVTGTPISYQFNEGATIRATNSPPTFVRHLVQREDGAYESRVGARQETAYREPGVYRVTFEVFNPGQPPTYYTMRQVVRAPSDVAREALLGLPGTAPDAGLYLQAVDVQINGIEDRLRGLRAEAGAIKPQSFFEMETPRYRQVAAEIRTLETGLAELKRIKETLPDKLFGGAAGAPVPLQAALIPTERPQAIPLQLYAKPLGDNRWAIVDATSPANARVYEGRGGATPAEGMRNAWAEFIASNNLPGGQIAARPPQGFAFPANEVWNAASDGQSGLQQWASGLGWGSLALGVLGVASLFGPGTQVAAPYLFGAAGVVGAASGGANAADRIQHGNFELFSQETAIDVLAVVGGFASAGGATATLLRAGRTTIALADGTSITLSNADRLGKFVTIANTVDAAAGVTNGVVIAATHLQQIERINADPTLTPQQKREQVQAVITQAVATGGLIVLGHGLGKAAVTRQATEAVADNATVINNLARGLSGSEIDELLVKHGGNTVKWAASESDGAAARRLLTELDAPTINSLQSVSGRQALELLNVFGKDQLNQIAAQVGGKRLTTMVELLGANSAKGVVGEMIRRNKISELITFADNLSAARAVELAAPKPLGAKSVVVDNNTLVAVGELQKGAAWAELPVRYQNSINQVRAQVGLPPLTTNPTSRSMSGILGTADVRVPNAVIGEAQPNPNLVKGGLQLTVSRSDAAYQRVLAELETPPPVGGNKGFADRAAIADVLFARTTGGIPRFVTADKDIYIRLAENYNKSGVLRPMPNEPKADAVIRQFPRGFGVEIDGRKMFVVPVQTP